MTLEANPEDEAGLSDFRAAGIDRLSLGVQSLDEESLKALGRGHSVAQARIALERAIRLFRESHAISFTPGRVRRWPPGGSS